MCKGIIFLCIAFIFICIGYALCYTTYRPKAENTELEDEVAEIAEYYIGYEQEMDDESEGEEILPSPITEYSQKEMVDVIKANDAPEEVIKTSQEEDMLNVQETEKILVKAEDSYRRLLNDVPLNPIYPEEQELKEVLEQLMPEITEGCSDTYDKVKACYDYLIETCSYSPTEKYSYEYDAYLLLTERHGSCTYYAAAFHYMMLYIGLDDEIVSSYRMLGTEPSFHRWNEIIIDGSPYIFDTQWEDSWIGEEGIQYNFFFKTHEEMQGCYMFQ